MSVISDLFAKNSQPKNYVIPFLSCITRQPVILSEIHQVYSVNEDANIFSSKRMS